MGLFSEVSSGIHAEKLEKILFAGIKTRNSEVINFLKTNVYLVYLEEIAETWGADKVNKELRRVYGGK